MPEAVEEVLSNTVDPDEEKDKIEDVLDKAGKSGGLTITGDVQIFLYVVSCALWKRVCTNKIDKLCKCLLCCVIAFYIKR